MQDADWKDLGNFEKAALRHINGLRGRPYWGKLKSMKKLAARGLVERCPGIGSAACPAWKITDAGLQVLNGH